MNYLIKKIYFIAMNKTRYRKRVEVIANADRGKIRPVLSHLKNLIFLLIILAIDLNRFSLNLLKAEGYIK